MNSILVSIIMPAYNCEKFIKQAIDSILNQTHTNFELLIADDCSTDTTKNIIDSYSDLRIKRFHNENNLGYLNASNKLFSKCTGNYITFQDADDYSDLTRIEKLVNFLEINEDIGCCYSNNYGVDENGIEIGRSKFPLTHEEIYSEFLRRVVFCGAAIMLRGTVLKKVGFYDEYFHRLGNEDKQWFGKILENSKVFCIDEPLYYYRLNQNSVSRTRENKKAYISEDIAKFCIIHLRSDKKDLLNDFSMKNKLNQYENERFAIYLLKESTFIKGLSIFSKVIFKFNFSNEFFREGLSQLKFALLSKSISKKKQ